MTRHITKFRVFVCDDSKDDQLNIEDCLNFVTVEFPMRFPFSQTPDEILANEIVDSMELALHNTTEMKIDHIIRARKEISD